jgi:hypothetical protein
MPMAKARHDLRLSVLFLTLFAAGALAQETPLISGQNINMVSGTEWPTGDPFLQRQNEPTIGVSTRNELHLMGGSNDYRTVDLPGLPEGKTTGDSWISSYFSYDGGGRWTSTLLPGYPQDMSAIGQASPLYLAGYEASADPVIRPGTHGIFYYSGIAFTRGDNPPSAGFVSTYIDLNNDERGDTIKFVRTTIFDQNSDGSTFIDKPWIAVDKPRNLATTFIEVPTDSGFVTQEVQCGNLYAAWARIQGEGSAATSSQIMFAKSEDCGATFSEPKTLTLPNTINQGAAIAVSPLDGEIRVAWRQFANATMSCTLESDYWGENPEAWPVDEIEIGGETYESADAGSLFPDSGKKGKKGKKKSKGSNHDTSAALSQELLTTWLNVLSGADNSEIAETMEAADAWLIEFPPESNKKKKKSKKKSKKSKNDKTGKELLKDLRDFNKGKTGPGHCDDLPAGGSSGTHPNAIMATSSSDFGDTFSEPVSVASSDDYYFPFEQGTTEYSFRSTGYPTLTYDGVGRSYIAFTTRGLAIPDFDVIGGDGRVVISTSMDGTVWTAPLPIDEPEQHGHQLMPALDFAQGKVFLLYYDFRADVSGVFDRFITDFPVDATTPRHSVDVRAAQALAAETPIFTDYSVLDNKPSTQTSRYPYLILSDEAGEPVSQQTKYNPPNLPMFKGGLVPFFGDFIDLATLHFVRDDTGSWDFNTEPGGAPVVHAVWTDNRDVVPPSDGDWTGYVPPGVGGTTSIFDASQTVPVCTPSTVGDRTRMRNQNIYTSRLTQGLVLAVPGNNRPLGEIQRAFVGFVQNLTDQDKLFRLEILNQPVGGSASFEQFSLVPSIVKVVERNSSISRSIYVESTDPSASVDLRVVEVDEMGVPIGNGLTATTRINADPSAPLPVDAGILSAEEYTPAIFNPAIFNPAIFNPALLGSDAQVGIYNPAIFNPAIFNNPEDAEFTRAALQQLALLNPAIFNPAIFNPAIFNPAIFNMTTANPAIFNPAIFNPAIFNSTVDDTVLETSVVIENQGNTTAAYNLNLDLDQPPEGFIFQVMVYRTYIVPSVEGCELVQNVLQEQLVNELTPDVNGDLLNPDATSFYIAPEDSVVVTVRVVADPNAAVPGDPATINTLETLMLSQAVAPQAVDTESAEEGETQPTPVVVVAPGVPLLVIDPVSLADATSNSAYSQTLNATGGDGSPVIWSLVPGSTLPPGLSLSSAGQISGTATSQGVFAFDVRAQDDVQVTEQGFSIEVLAGESPEDDLYTYQTIIDLAPHALEPPPDGIDTVIIDWITPVSSGHVDTSDLTYLSIAFLSGENNLYHDISIIDGVVQPIGGVARPLSDLLWDFYLDGDFIGLSQVRNAFDSTMTQEGAAGTHYQISDGVAIPIDNELRFKRFVDGEFQAYGIGLVTSQSTRLLRVESEGSIIASTRWRADFDLSASGQPPPFVPGPYVCIRNHFLFGSNLPGMNVQVFDDAGGPVIGQTVFPVIPANNVGHETFLSGTALADGIGYMLVEFPQAIALNALSVEGRSGGCIKPPTGTAIPTGFVDSILTPDP